MELVWDEQRIKGFRGTEKVQDIADLHLTSLSARARDGRDKKETVSHS